MSTNVELEVFELPNPEDRFYHYRKIQVSKSRLRPSTAVSITHESYSFSRIPLAIDDGQFLRENEVTIVLGAIPSNWSVSERESEPSFYSRTFRFEHKYYNAEVERTIRDISQFIREVREEHESLTLIVVDAWSPWISEAFRNIIPTVAEEFFSAFESNPEVTVLPDIQDGTNFTCVMDQVDTLPINTSYEARRMPIAMWCQLKGDIASSAPKPDISNSPLVVLYAKSDHNFPRKLLAFYISEENTIRYWERLTSCPLWVYVDILSTFTDWDATWTEARRKLRAREKMLYEGVRSTSVLEQTQQLHKSTAISIDLRESMRLQMFSLKRFHELLEKHPELPLRAELMARLKNKLLSLDYFELMSSTLLDQQDNLLNMTFNTEAFIQTQAVNRLTVLGFVFLPISLVASIFGMTTFTTPARWYPVAAIPTLVVTIAMAILINKLIPVWDKLSRRVRKLSNRKPTL